MIITDGRSDYVMRCPTAVALGKFDGLHLGHRELFRKIQSEYEYQSAAVTLWPDDARKALLSRKEKKLLFEKMGVDFWIDYPVLSAFCEMEAEEFVREVLQKRLQAALVVVGDDFRFGKGRNGDCSLLGRMQRECGFELRIIPQKLWNKEAVSSTLIREKLLLGKMRDASELLGYPYFLHGILKKQTDTIPGAAEKEKHAFVLNGDVPGDMPVLFQPFGNRILPGDGCYEVTAYVSDFTKTRIFQESFSELLPEIRETENSARNAENERILCGKLKICHGFLSFYTDFSVIPAMFYDTMITVVFESE